MVLARGWQDQPVKASGMPPLPLPLLLPHSFPWAPTPVTQKHPLHPPCPTEGGRGLTKAYPHFMGDTHVQAACAPWDSYDRLQPGRRGD